MGFSSRFLGLSDLRAHGQERIETMGRLNVSDQKVGDLAMVISEPIFLSCICMCLLPFFFSFGCTCGRQKFLGRGLNLCHCSNLSHSSDNAGSLIHWATRELLLSLSGLVWVLPKTALQCYWNYNVVSKEKRNYFIFSCVLSIFEIQVSLQQIIVQSTVSLLFYNRVSNIIIFKIKDNAMVNLSKMKEC